MSAPFIPTPGQPIEVIFRSAHRVKDTYSGSEPQIDLVCECHPGFITGKGHRTGLRSVDGIDRPVYRIQGTFGPHHDQASYLAYLANSRLEMLAEVPTEVQI